VTAAGEDPNRRSRAGFERRYSASFVFPRRVCYDALVGAESARGAHRTGFSTRRNESNDRPVEPNESN